MLMHLLGFAGYYVGLGIEGAIILVAGIFLVLMLTGVLFGAKKPKQLPNDDTVLMLAEQSEPVIIIDEHNEVVAAEADEQPQAQPEPQPAQAPVEEPVEEEEEEVKPKKKAKKKKDDDEELLTDDEEEEPTEQGVVFGETKSIMELYDELSNEQKSFFDELREEALTKPDSELSTTKNYVSVKIGKRNLIKLFIKRGVTVAEFMLENQALKQFKQSSKNKKGKSSIKVKPTVVQVIDLPSLKVAVDMINLAYEEMMED